MEYQEYFDMKQKDLSEDMESMKNRLLFGMSLGAAVIAVVLCITPTEQHKVANTRTYAVEAEADNSINNLRTR